MDKDDLYHIYLSTYLYIEEERERYRSIVDVFTKYSKMENSEITTLEMITLVIAYTDIKDKIPPRSDDDFLEIFEEKLNEHWDKIG